MRHDAAVPDIPLRTDERVRAVNIARLGLASVVVTVALLAGCTNSDTREAAPVAAAVVEAETSETPSPEEAVTPDESATEVEVESDDLTTEPIATTAITARRSVTRSRNDLTHDRECAPASV